MAAGEIEVPAVIGASGSRSFVLPADLAVLHDGSRAQTRLADGSCRARVIGVNIGNMAVGSSRLQPGDVGLELVRSMIGRGLHISHSAPRLDTFDSRPVHSRPSHGPGQVPGIDVSR